MTYIFSCNQSYYTAAECFVAGNLFRKTPELGERGKLWGLLDSARAHVPQLPCGTSLHKAKPGQSTKEIAFCLFKMK